jgi:hypothetical protein
LYFFALPFLGVIVSVIEQEPLLRGRTVVPVALQILLDDVATFGITFEEEGTEILRFLSRQFLATKTPIFPTQVEESV